MTADQNPDQSDSTGGTVGVATPMNLSLDVVETKQELALAVPTEDAIDPEIEDRASQYADQLLTVDTSDVDAVDRSRSAVETMGRDLQRQAASRSEMLQQPIRELTRPDSPRFVEIPESERPVVQMPVGGDLIHAPTGAVMF